MFTGISAQFLAVLETLLDHKSRPLIRTPSHPVTDLDDDTVTDVYEELLCAGTDLVLGRLNQCKGTTDSIQILQLAVKGKIQKVIN